MQLYLIEITLMLRMARHHQHLLLFGKLFYRFGGQLPSIRVHRLLEGIELVPEHGWVKAWDGNVALETFNKLGALPEEKRANIVLKKIKNNLLGQTDELSPDAFTGRELEILCEMARGKSNPDIASDHFISIRTVERHVSNIYAKLGTSGKSARAVATAYAHQKNLIN